MNKKIISARKNMAVINDTGLCRLLEDARRLRARLTTHFALDLDNNRLLVDAEALELLMKKDSDSIQSGSLIIYYDKVLRLDVSVSIQMQNIEGEKVRLGRIQDSLEHIFARMGQSVEISLPELT